MRSGLFFALAAVLAVSRASAQSFLPTSQPTPSFGVGLAPPAPTSTFAGGAAPAGSTAFGVTFPSGLTVTGAGAGTEAAPPPPVGSSASVTATDVFTLPSQQPSAAPGTVTVTPGQVLTAAAALQSVTTQASPGALPNVVAVPMPVYVPTPVPPAPSPRAAPAEMEAPAAQEQPETERATSPTATSPTAAPPSTATAPTTAAAGTMAPSSTFAAPAAAPQVSRVIYQAGGKVIHVPAETSAPAASTMQTGPAVPALTLVPTAAMQPAQIATGAPTDARPAAPAAVTGPVPPSAAAPAPRGGGPTTETSTRTLPPDGGSPRATTEPHCGITACTDDGCRCMLWQQ